MTVPSLACAETVGWLRETFDPGARCDVEHEAAGSLGYGWLHYGLVRMARPARVLAIGSRTGFIPAVLALAVRDNGIGHVDFVDASYDTARDGLIAHDGIGWWDTHTFGPLDAVVTIHRMRTDAFFPQCRDRYGYVHIDGGHDDATVAHDLRESAARLEPGGFVALHDAASPQLGVRGVVAGMGKAWSVWDVPGTWGLAVAQRRVR